ncbi:Pyridoxamine 5'-phosphate oxidase [Salinihabitans flavidus]|uniref:Pyridoxamine 5'-phosphate oxidase n=1 Tax=Salinihabitans flavidus TaxID=569882 RepID=A0A1H8SU64_9RHOB|nr:pyridoxamine 5'-phosphate oxidase family protein [Salinihabitans flavidus]SEO82201.1 Pyridoxamine 5'-phosphate oxidase [Salinihabitans flavidus]
MPTPFDPEDVLRLPLVAILASCETDGSPRNAPVWFHWEEGALFMLSDDSASSARRILNDPRVAVEIIDYDNGQGIMRHLGLRGRATIEPMNPALFRRLLSRYLGPDETRWNPWFIETVARIDDPSGRLIRLAPDSIFTNDVSFFRTGPELATS